MDRLLYRRTRRRKRTSLLVGPVLWASCGDEMGFVQEMNEQIDFLPFITAVSSVDGTGGSSGWTARPRDGRIPAAPNCQSAYRLGILDPE
ncbi:hypothetical protein PHLGIDRAFT_419800 [Phlebiopsis gigantea 11061_1 CR5-6]|uniref:Uncharacterized protein n=1 Tax=Phlebiopsis gigantea (strain 11061_1 CR5-6) TaxID=745531 RepID=A0A0C3P229_PHLG1|nr:hypothetical protein PHLGIDRAFT_419800 [Phlebiopsis gigantea 11061_1 CR5-6]